jgi:hypothetical protein
MVRALVRASANGQEKNERKSATSSAGPSCAGRKFVRSDRGATRQIVALMRPDSDSSKKRRLHTAALSF